MAQLDLDRLMRVSQQPANSSYGMGYTVYAVCTALSLLDMKHPSSTCVYFLTKHYNSVSVYMDTFWKFVDYYDFFLERHSRYKISLSRNRIYHTVHFILADKIGLKGLCSYPIVYDQGDFTEQDLDNLFI